MLKALLLSLTMALAAMATAQNLVPNPSFEELTDCDQYPNGTYEFMLGLARPWFSANTATPDIYDCDLERRCGQPMDPDDLEGVVLQGFQSAYHGQRMAAGFQWYGPGVPPEQDTRDYMMVRLLEPLEAERSYAVSLFYSRAEGYGLAIDHLGVHFGMDSVHAPYPTVLDLTPQVDLRDPVNTYLIEGQQWVQLVDTFSATGGEEWMIIGTFDGSDEVNGTDVLPGMGSNYAYYYIDQVSVVQLGPAQSIEEWVAWYTGNGGLDVRWSGSATLDRIRLFDAAGKLLMEDTPNWPTGVHTLDRVRSLAAGVYVLEGWSATTRRITRFIVEEGVR